MPKLIRAESLKYKPSNFGLREFHQKRNTILIVREVGGAGDILVHRMIFEDFKKQNTDCKIHFACPEMYHELVQDHPYIDKVLDSRTIEYSNYIISYNTSSACGRYEMAIAPRSGLNRSDIWANHCGLELTHHDMHINLSPETVDYGKKTLRGLNPDDTKPTVVIAPISAMSSKNLLPDQLEGTIKGLQMRNCYVCASHNCPILELEKLGVPVVGNMNMKKWMGIVNAADYVVSVDTGCFHLACGLKKPTVGIFTFADSKVYSRYYTCELVQKHRDNGDWPCGPCYNASNCPKTNKPDKPCLTEITTGMIMDGFDRLLARFPWKKDKNIKLDVIYS